MANQRRVVAFCPWIAFRQKPLEIAGVHVMGFREAEGLLIREDQPVLWRANQPYYDHFLDAHGQLRHWNENPLIYVVDRSDPLKELSPNEIRLLRHVNSFLYVSTFALNRSAAWGLEIYTNATDWSLYFQPVQDPKFFAVGERRLYGSIIGGGHQWAGSAFTLPVECNHFELLETDASLVEGVTHLQAAGRAEGYTPPVRTFMLGTSDNHLWGRFDDLPLIWGAFEQVPDCTSFETCGPAQAAVDQASKEIQLRRDHWGCLARAVIGKRPKPEHIWKAAFRPGRRGGPSEIDQARGKGILFSTLERSLDELNFARNSMVHEGHIPALQWNVVSLAWLGSRFWIVVFKRILGWEGVRLWTQQDDCEIEGLQAFAIDGQASLVDGYRSYEAAVEACRRQRQREILAKEIEI